MSKKNELFDILVEVLDLYPNVEKVLMDDVNDPDYIIMCSPEKLREFSEIMGIDFESLEESYSSIKKKEKYITLITRHRIYLAMVIGMIGHSIYKSDDIATILGILVFSLFMLVPKKPNDK